MAKRPWETTLDGEALQSLFDAAVRAQGEGRLDEAETGFRAVLAHSPHESAALFGLGVTLMHARRFPEAVEALEAAAALDPAPLTAVCLGQALYLTGDFGRSAGAFAAADAVEALTGGARLTWARAAAYHALLDQPADIALAHYGEIAGREAEDLAVVAQEGLPALIAFGRLDPARKLGHWLTANTAPDPVRDHELRVLFEPAIDKAPEAYVEALFDAFADRFDHHLVDLLEYRAPAVLVELIARHGQHFGRILDLGCGTGLAAPHLARFGGAITGVDLSSAMLAKAAERGGYAVLTRAEATAFLQTHPGAFDLIAAADVLIYFGDLGAVIAAAAGALSPGGLLAFSVERGQDGWTLLPSARYAHADAYVRATAAPWFEVVEHDELDLRRQGAAATPGALYVLKRR